MDEIISTCWGSKKHVISEDKNSKKHVPFESSLGKLPESKYGLRHGHETHFHTMEVCSPSLLSEAGGLGIPHTFPVSPCSHLPWHTASVTVSHHLRSMTSLKSFQLELLISLSAIDLKLIAINPHLADRCISILPAIKPVL